MEILWIPGLITKLHDIKNHYKFTLISFQKNDELIDDTIPTKAVKVKRVAFLKESANGDLENKINKSISQTMGFGPSQKSVRMYDNIELDYK